MPEKCYVIHCNNQSVAKGLCDKHRKRMVRTNSLEITADRGMREKHPCYRVWCGLRRRHNTQLPNAWKEDFWAFVNDIPPKPPLSSAFRPRKNEMWSKNNFYWKESKVTEAFRTHRNEYMRQYTKKMRATNPDYFKDQDLQRMYGISLDWYKEQSEKQGHVCAICKQPETAIIRGKPISLAVDHDKQTGKVRGLLCRACNNAIGGLKHDIQNFQNAIEYLKF
jgi:hypothetical protein